MKYDIVEEFKDFKENEKGEYIIVSPVQRFEISKKISIGKYNLYPKGTLNFDGLTKNIISDKIEENRLFFNKNTLLVFQHVFDISKPFSQIYDKEFISEAFQESEKLLNLLKFFYCKYFDSSTLIGKSGQREDGKNVIFVFHGIGSPFTGIKEDYLLTHKITKGIGLKVVDFSPIERVGFFDNTKNEVGNILLQALELNTMVLEANTNTQKFILIMNLIEYLSYPTSYEQFKKVKTKIICHNTDNIADYHRLANRFEELTGGLKDEKTGEKILGLRTQIVHLGKKIEDIIADNISLSKLFKELQGYVYNTIMDMFALSTKTWDDLDNFRQLKWNLIQENKLSKNKKGSYSENIILIDLDFLDKEASRWLKFYKELYPLKKINQVFIEDLVIQSCIQSKIENSEDILTVILVSSQKNNYIFSEKVIKLNENQFFSFDAPKLYKFDIQIIQVSDNQNKYSYITKLLEEISKEGNSFADGISGKINGYFLCIDDKSYFEYLTDLGRRKYLQLIRLSGWETELNLKDVMYIDVAHVIGLSLGLKTHEL